MIFIVTHKLDRRQSHYSLLTLSKQKINTESESNSLSMWQQPLSNPLLAARTGAERHVKLRLEGREGKGENKTSSLQREGRRKKYEDIFAISLMKWSEPNDESRQTRMIEPPRLTLGAFGTASRDIVFLSLKALTSIHRGGIASV